MQHQVGERGIGWNGEARDVRGWSLSCEGLGVTAGRGRARLQGVGMEHTAPSPPAAGPPFTGAPDPLLAWCYSPLICPAGSKEALRLPRVGCLLAAGALGRGWLWVPVAAESFWPPTAGLGRWWMEATQSPYPVPCGQCLDSEPTPCSWPTLDLAWHGKG